MHASATYETLNTKATEVVRSLRQYVINVYGPDSPVLADFGFTAPRRSPLTHEQLVARAQKAAATPRSRPYRKNDQTWIEQKNGSVVRRLVGYRRLEGIRSASRPVSMIGRVRFR